VITEEELFKEYGGRPPLSKVVIKDRIADARFRQVLLRPEEYEVIALPNTNGDYLSDPCAAQVGGLGMAPGANIGTPYAVFEATHGSAPKYARQGKVNASSLILSRVMMLEHLSWVGAGELIIKALEKTIKKGPLPVTWRGRWKEQRCLSAPSLPRPSLRIWSRSLIL